MFRDGQVIGSIFVGRREAGLFTDPGRAAEDVRRPGGHRDRERAAVHGAGGPQPRPHRGAGAADGDERDPARHQPARRPTSSRCSTSIASSARAAVRRASSAYVVHVRRRTASISRRCHGVTPEGVEAAATRSFPCRPDADTVPARAVSSGERRPYPRRAGRSGLRVDETRARPAATAACSRCRCCARAAPIGAICVGRRRARAVSDKQVALLKTFADQAVIAIENVRLFTELEARNRDLTEALEQQTATSEILRVISQLADRRAAGVRHDRGGGAQAVRRQLGERLHVRRRADPPGGTGQRGRRKMSTRSRRFFPRPPGRDTAVTARRSESPERRRTSRTCDEDAEYAIRASSTTGGFRSVLAVPLLREESAIGAIAVGRRRTRAVLRTTRSRCSRPSPTRRSSPSRTCGCSRNWRRGPRS